jgi:prepilin-type N-terminal cleavage/methylation domain-containing protein
MKNKKAFTLVELIVVVTILIILSTISFYSVKTYVKKSRDAVRINDLAKIELALEVEVAD